MPKVNPHILKWARETAGLTQEEATSKLAIKDTPKLSAIERLTALEKGVSEPTRSILSRMAKKYHRPLLTFYMQDPPRKGDRGQDFRTLPEEIDIQENALVDVLIRDIKSRQAIVRAALQDEEEIEPLRFIGSITLGTEKNEVVEKIVGIIKFDINQFRRKSPTILAFEYLRACVEDAGVFVLLRGNLGSYHTNIDPEVFRGFALADTIAPFIVINEHDSKSAWSFTLLHEFVHLMLGLTGISSVVSDRRVEKFCNEVSSAILMPSDELKVIDLNNGMSFDEIKSTISKFAQRRNISATMVAYNLWRQGRLGRTLWNKLRVAFKQDFDKSKLKAREKARSKEGGPDYIIVRRQRLGNALIDFVFHTLSEGSMTTVKAARVLGVNPRLVGDVIRPKNLNR